jgi:hypothetical protein
VMAGILADVRTEHPGLRVVLNEGDAEHCAPGECEVRRRLPVQLANILLRRGLIQSTCRRARNSFTCGPRGWMYVGLSPIHETPHKRTDRKGTWVQVTVRIPCPGCQPDLIGTWYRLERSADGRWTVHERLPAFVF